LVTTLKNTVGIWLILTIIFLPFPYFLFNPFFSYSSDAISTYYLAGILLILSILFSIFQYLFKFIKQEKLERFLYTSVAYILSYFLLKYGIDKLLLRQFYTPEPNILFTPVGHLSKDILFWSTMGTSKIYNVFMGLIEIIPGIFLLHHKTRIFGAFCAFGVLLNVFMINVGFDISVKLLSLYLVIAATFLLQPVLMKLFDLFVRQKTVSALTPPHLSFSNQTIKRQLKSITISLILLDVVLPYLEPKSVHESQIETYVGSYENKSLNEKFFNHSIKRIHIHRKGYFIVEDVKGKFYDYKFTVIEKSIYLLKEKVSIEIDSNNKAISWKENHQLKKIQVKKINENSIPLLKDEFHWTVNHLKFS